MKNNLITIAEISPKETVIWQCPSWVGDMYVREKPLCGKNYSISKFIRDINDYWPELEGMVKEISRAPTFSKIEGQSYDYVSIDELAPLDQIIDEKLIPALILKEK